MIPSDVSVIIPALNEAGCIETAIDSAWGNGAGEVIVCDGGSTDLTVSLADGMGALVVCSDPGRGLQLRSGAAVAQGLMLLFLHADNWLHAGCLENLCRRLPDASGCSRPGGAELPCRPGCAWHPGEPDCQTTAPDASEFWGGFRQHIDDPRFRFRCLEWGNAARIRWRGMPFGDQAMFVTRSMYGKVGGFPTTPLMEDVNLSKKLRAECWPMLIDARVHVDARRWRKRGVFRQTLRNWGIQCAHGLGVSESRLAVWYRS